MSESNTVEMPSKLRLAGYVLVAVLVALSWLGLGIVLDVDPTGFAVSESSSPDDTEWDRPPENVTVDELRESLTRTNQGGASSVSMTTVWATDTYFDAAGLDAETYEVTIEDNHVFLVFLDTHTGTLPEIDWQSEATLIVDGERYEPADGHLYAGGYHHLAAVVEFPETVDGEPLFDENTENVTLEIVGIERNEQDIAPDKPRTVSWTYPPPYQGADPGAFADSECECEIGQQDVDTTEEN